MRTSVLKLAAWAISLQLALCVWYLAAALAGPESPFRIAVGFTPEVSLILAAALAAQIPLVRRWPSVAWVAVVVQYATALWAMTSFIMLVREPEPENVGLLAGDVVVALVFLGLGFFTSFIGAIATGRATFGWKW